MDIRCIDTCRLFRQFEERLDHAYNTMDIAPFPGADKLVETLRARGIKVALDTGYSKRVAELILAKINWYRHVHYDTLVTTDMVDRGRPYPDMILRAMQETGITDNVLKVGDTTMDINEGIAAGCKVILGITTGSQSRDQLLSSHPTAVIDRIEDVLSFI